MSEYVFKKGPQISLWIIFNIFFALEVLYFKNLILSCFFLTHEGH
jgi:hypothetical protein